MTCFGPLVTNVVLMVEVIVEFVTIKFAVFALFADVLVAACDVAASIELVTPILSFVLLVTSVVEVELPFDKKLVGFDDTVVGTFQTKISRLNNNEFSKCVFDVLIC